MKNALNKEDILKILANYSLGSYVSHKYIQAIWGDVRSLNYKLLTNKGAFVLKIENMEINEILFQNKVMNYLFENNILVQRVYKTKSNESYLNYNNKFITIKDYLEGSTPKTFSIELIREIAKNLGLMQNVLLKSNLSFKKPFFNEIFFKYDYMKDVKDKELLDYYDNLAKNLKLINYEKLRKCLSHRDITEVNLIINNGRFAGFIDFEEAGTDYLINDVSTFISSCLLDKTNGKFKESIKAFLAEYQKSIKLNNEEKKAIYYFIQVGIITAEWIRPCYKDFGKISLEEFMNFY